MPLHRSRSPRRRDDSTPSRPRATRPRLEGLEDRFLLYATSGGLWTYGTRITYSFMPDGTSIGGVSSNLFSTLNAQYSTATWEAQFEKAAAVWEEAANINLALVPDDGAALGVSGNQQDDSRFGDIRIGAYAESPGQLAFTILPPPINGGTAAGDILFNSTVNWSSTGFDLETVAIHEIGHALGMDHSAITYADMYAYYNGIKQTLTSDDTAGIQSIYGPQPAGGTNINSSTATDVTSLISNNQIAIPGLNNPTYPTQAWYKVTVPSTTTGTMTVTMQSSNLSSLAPRITVFNSSVGGIGQALAANTYGATVSYTVSSVTSGQVYYFRATAANNGAGSVGGYGLEWNFGTGTQAPIAPPNTVVAEQPDQGGGSQSDSSTPGAVSISTTSTALNAILASFLPSNGPVDTGPSALQLGNSTVWGDALTILPSSTPATPAAYHSPADILQALDQELASWKGLVPLVLDPVDSSHHGQS